MFYLLCEDFARALVGPFDGVVGALAHQAFLKARGDGGACEIITAVRAEALRGTIHLRLTPEEDRKLNHVPSARHSPE